MHRQINALVSAGSSPGKLAVIGIALGEAGIDIATVGGAEWRHDGPLSIMLKHDSTDQLNAFAQVCHDHTLPWLVFRTVAVELVDEPGALGAVADVVAGPDADINIYSVNVLKPRNGKPVVGLGIRPSQVDAAVERLVNHEPPFEASRLAHPNEPSPWWDDWDQRTEDLLPLFDDESVAADDPRFWQIASQGA
jgi:hypothetical protein